MSYFVSFIRRGLATLFTVSIYDGMNFSEKLVKALDERNISQTELGNLIGLQQSRVSRWAKGKGMPTCPQILKIARALSVSIDYLLDDTIEEMPSALSPDLAFVLEFVARVGAKEVARRLAEGVAVQQPTVLTPSTPPVDYVALRRAAEEEEAKKAAAKKAQSRRRSSAG